MTQPFKARPAPRWKQPRPKWKNLFCVACGMWVDRERLTQHAQSPRHTRNAKQDGRLVRPERAA
jgi:hypothetical protein